MSTLHKFNRLLVVHGIDPTKANILKIEQNPELSQISINIEYDGIEYLINETSKIIIDKKSIKKPRGWHFKDIFVDSEDNVYFKGIEQPELKGTLPQT